MISIFFLIASTIYSQTIDEWSLGKCIDYAYKQNITIRKSELAIRRSEINAEQAKTQRFPSAGATINQNFNWGSSAAGGSGLTGSNESYYSVNSGVTLFGVSRITNEIKQAELNIQSGALSLEATKESISLSVLNAFLQVLFAEEQVKNSERQIESTKAQVNLATERLNLNAISQADYAQVISQLASEKLILANSESQLSIARINLMQLMELPVQDNFRISHPNLQEEINQNRLPDVKRVYETALAIKPQIKNAAVNKEIAGLDQKIAKASHFPVLSASAGLTTRYSGKATDTYLGQLNYGLSPAAGFTLSIPVFQRRQAKTSVAVARLDYTDAELTELDTRNQLRKNIEQACLDVTSAQVEYEASLEKYKATHESLALSEEKYNQGLINSVDYLLSKTNLIVAESQSLQSKYKLIFSYKVLDFYMGIPLSL